MAKVTTSVQIEDNSSTWIAKQKQSLLSAAMAMGNAIKSSSAMTVPRDTSTLAKSATVKASGNTVTVTYGNTNVRYAMVQERGMRNGVPFKHYTTPGTGPHYLENAGNAVAKKGLKAYL